MPGDEYADMDVGLDPGAGEDLALKMPVKVSACSSDPRITEATRNTTSHDEDLIRRQAANQILSAALANFVNTKRDGLILTVEFSDGGLEDYRHTTFGGWGRVDGTLKLGTGVAGSKCQGSVG